MCNRYRVTADDTALIARYGVSPLGEYERLPPPELFPKKPAYVVRAAQLAQAGRQITHA